MVLCVYLACGPLEDTCRAFETLCGGVCVELSKNPEHCGKCGQKCPERTICSGGKCQACPLHEPDVCENRCVNVKHTFLHCGKCGQKCADGLICSSGNCSCPLGTQSCQQGCFPLESDPNNCGDCGVRCEKGQRCLQGRCTGDTCSKGFAQCNRSCVYIAAHPQHCGGCGRSCHSFQLCFKGQCRCPFGQLACDASCVDIRTDYRHCGGCGKACPSGQFCANGQCVMTCPVATSDMCFGGCFDVSSNVFHCGRCGNACSAGQQCSKGNCACPTGRIPCGNRCVDTSSDYRNCGTCKKRCAQGERCANGQCVKSCPSETPDACGQGCYDFQREPKHCGGCNKACVGKQHCIEGVCRCRKGMQDCGGACVDIQTDWGHCGKCGQRCAPEEVCLSGKCRKIADCAGDGLTNCAGSCVQLSVHPEHCGQCGNRCIQGYACSQGKCTKLPQGPSENTSEIAKESFHEFGKKEFLTEALPEGVVDGGAIHPESGVLEDVPKKRADDAFCPSKSCPSCGCFLGLHGKELVRVRDFTIWKHPTTGQAHLYIMGTYGIELKMSGIYDRADKSPILKGRKSTSTFVARVELDSRTLLWMKSIQGIAPANKPLFGAMLGRGLAVDQLGNAFVVGEYDSKFTWAGQTHQSKGIQDAFVLQLGSLSGSEVWAGSGGGSALDRASRVAIGANQNLLVGGEFNSKDFQFDALNGASQKVTSNPANSDIFLAVIDPRKKQTYLNTLRRAGSVNYHDTMGEIASDPGGKAIALIGTFGKNNSLPLTGFAKETYTKDHLTETTLGLGLVKSDFSTSHWKAFSALKIGKTQFGVSKEVSKSLAVALAPGGTVPTVYALGEFKGSFGWKLKDKLVTISSTEQHCFLTKIKTQNETPRLVWSTLVGELVAPKSWLRPKSIVVDANKSTKPVYITGNFSGSVRFGQRVLTAKKETLGLFIAKYENNTFQAIQMQCTISCYADKVALDERGRVYIGGRFRGELGFGSLKIRSSPNSFDGFIYRLPEKW